MNRWITLSMVALAFCILSIARVDAKNFVKDSKNKTKLGSGTVGTQSGLQYKDIKIGKGAKPRHGQSCEVHYTGWLYPSGKKFDSSVDRKVPFKFMLGTGQVIKGWDIGVSTMKVGGKRVLLIPPELAYGKKRINRIPPNSTLKFEIELLKVR